MRGAPHVTRSAHPHNLCTRTRNHPMSRARGCCCLTNTRMPHRACHARVRREAAGLRGVKVHHVFPGPRATHSWHVHASASVQWMHSCRWWLCHCISITVATQPSPTHGPHARYPPPCCYRASFSPPLPTVPPRLGCLARHSIPPTIKFKPCHTSELRPILFSKI